MSIASEISKLISNLADCYTACTNKGATLPANENFDNLATCISSISGGGGGNQYYRYTVEGSPTISNGEVSDFSDSDYLSIPVVYNDTDSGQIIEFMFPIMLTTSGSSTDGIYDERLFTGPNASNFINGFRLTVDSSNMLRFRFAYTSNSVLDLQGTTSLSLNTKYYVKFIFDNRDSLSNVVMSMETSTDGTNWTTYASAQMPYTGGIYIASTGNKNLGLGFIGRNAATASGYYFRGKIYIDEAYIKIGNKVRWGKL